MKLILHGLGVLYLIVDPNDTKDVLQTAKNIKHLETVVNGKIFRWTQIAEVPQSVATEF